MQDDNFKPARELGNGLTDLPGTGIFPTAEPQPPIPNISTGLSTSNTQLGMMVGPTTWEWSQPTKNVRLAQFPDGSLKLQRQWRLGRSIVGNHGLQMGNGMEGYEWRTEPIVKVDANGAEIPGQLPV
jgi:hypothetical protein